MTNERELLRRALEDWDFSDKFETLDPIFEEIRTYLSNPSDDAEEPVEFKFIPTGKELLRYHPDEDCIETKVEFANYPAGSKFYPPKPAEPEAKPIGYVVQYSDGVLGSDIYYTPEEAVDYTEVDGIGIPVYRHPPKPAEPAARKPMTAKEMLKGIDADTYPYEEVLAFVTGIRYAEKHHGIGGGDE